MGSSDVVLVALRKSLGRRSWELLGRDALDLLTPSRVDDNAPELYWTSTARIGICGERVRRREIDSQVTVLSKAWGKGTDHLPIT